VFNDLWSVSVYADNGEIVYSKDKDVNSMVFSEPFWLSAGSTETITIDLDVTDILQSLWHKFFEIFKFVSY
jgi:hypothetical protein